MSLFTNYGENKVADYIRGQGSAWLPAAFYVALASAASDSSITELSGTGYARQAVTRSLANFAGTQGAGTTLASSGTSQKSSNNTLIDFGTSGAAWGTANYAVLYDASSSGNAIAYITLAAAKVIGSGVPVQLAPGEISFSLGLAGGTTHYFINKLIDQLFRGQTYAMPANGFFALFTAAPSNAGGGTEVSGGAYARQSLPFNMTGFSGTQAAASTSASSGTSGVISNNLVLTFPVPTAGWGTITHEGIFDALTAGNLLFWNALNAPRTVLTASSAQTHAAASWTLTIA